MTSNVQVIGVAGGIVLVADDISEVQRNIAEVVDEMAELAGDISKVVEKIANVEVEIAESKLQLDKSNLTDRERSLQTFVFKMKLMEKDKLQSQQVGLLTERKLLREAMKENISNLRAVKHKQVTSIDLFASISCNDGAFTYI